MVKFSQILTDKEVKDSQFFKKQSYCLILCVNFNISVADKKYSIFGRLCKCSKESLRVFPR